MNLCANCGVELDNDVYVCPLCGRNIEGDTSSDNDQKSDHYPSDILIVHRKEIRRQLWELSAIISFSGIAVCTIVDIVIGKSLSWSLYADTSILSVWIGLTLILLAHNRYLILIPGLLINILSMLFLYDLYSQPMNWFFGIALPVTLALFISVFIIIILWKLAHFKGFNILAIAFIVLSGFCIGTEIFIDKYLYKTVDIRWSAIVAAAVFPIALVLLFIHYRMRKGKRLDSYFHI